MRNPPRPAQDVFRLIDARQYSNVDTLEAGLAALERMVQDLDHCGYRSLAENFGSVVKDLAACIGPGGGYINTGYIERAADDPDYGNEDAKAIVETVRAGYVTEDDVVSAIQTNADPDANMEKILDALHEKYVDKGFVVKALAGLKSNESRAEDEALNDDIDGLIEKIREGAPDA